MTKLPHSNPLSVDSLRSLTHATPFLLMDLAAVAHRYHQFMHELPNVQVHYAMKCNPHVQVLQQLHSLGCKFEIASLGELQALTAIGVRPKDVLFSNPVKITHHISQAYKLGLYRFSFDSQTELEKIAAAAPGAAVYVRLQTTTASLVPSEGKFGIGASMAVDAMQYAKQLGLRPYGIAFHVGSQMQSAAAWATAIQQSAQVMRQLKDHNIQIEMLDMGGGFPATYQDGAPSLNEFATAIQQAITTHLPYTPKLLTIEPGRALVGDAGVMVATVIGLAMRGNTQWAHLDVGAFNGMMEALETQNRLRYPMKDSRGSARQIHYAVTGPSCDSQDTILFDVPLSADLSVDDRVFIYTAGAYTTSYASGFNGFSLPQTYCVGVK